ncbi:hypothetical protein BV22DRAFT_1051052 [Leucogyrophana mollusca]|uniref:Uncharacterized protein n=1 Tax=Leucogyrophana mollusca TaxID=85980 RepID=A0ACB8B2F7_9AGAM|nr:hypothetical protein BV22DRAFT_1051052 [Leucogyrophana mollusca]
MALPIATTFTAFFINSSERDFRITNLGMGHLAFHSLGEDNRPAILVACNSNRVPDESWSRILARIIPKQRFIVHNVVTIIFISREFPFIHYDVYLHGLLMDGGPVRHHGAQQRLYFPPFNADEYDNVGSCTYVCIRMRETLPLIVPITITDVGCVERTWLKTHRNPTTVPSSSLGSNRVHATYIPNVSSNLKTRDLVLLEAKITRYRTKENGTWNSRVQLEMEAISLLHSSDFQAAEDTGLLVSQDMGDITI